MKPLHVKPWFHHPSWMSWLISGLKTKWPKSKQTRTTGTPKFTCWWIMDKCLTRANPPSILYWTFFHPKRWMRCGKSGPCLHGKRVARFWALRESSEKHRKVRKSGPYCCGFSWQVRPCYSASFPSSMRAEKVRDWLSRALTCRWVRQHLLWETSGWKARLLKL